ncbi:MAG: hypothetical protein WCA77_09050 [Thermoplasmata archaeon]
MTSSGQAFVWGLLSNFPLGLPSLLLFVLTLGWIGWCRPASPPLLAPFPFRRSWMEASEAAVGESLRQGRYFPALGALYNLFVQEVALRHGVPPQAIDGTRSLRRLPGPPVPDVVVSLYRRFVGLHRRLLVIEATETSKSWLGLLRASARVNLEEDLADMLTEYGQAMAILRGAS